MKKIAIISPNKNAYSETFILAHKNLLKGDIDFLYGGSIPRHSEKNGSFYMFFQRKNISFKLKRLLPVFIFNKLYYTKLNNSLYFEYYLKTNKIEVILAEYGTTGADCLDIIKKLNIKLIVHFHGYDASIKELLEDYKVKYKEMFNYASSIIIVSTVMKQKLLELGCNEQKLVLNTYGPNEVFFETKPQFAKKKFIAIGRFVDKKAPYYTILAFNKVLKTHPDAKLIMAGDGPLLNSSGNLTRYLGIEKAIYFPGVISPEEFRNFLEESLGFVQHSITAENGDMEGTPVAILEASASGIPVISTKHAGIQDVIIHGITGLLTEEHDVEGMAENMIKLLNNAEMVQRLGENGKQRIKDNYTMDMHIKNIQNIIENAF